MYSNLAPLRDPVFLGAFAGRGGGSAAAAVQYLVDQWDAQPVGELDPEECFDFTVRRPVVRLDNGVRVVNWPKNQIFLSRDAASGRDVLLLPGIEPHIRWAAFCEAITDTLMGVGCHTAIILGSRTAALPHTRPVPFRLVTNEPSFSETFGTEATVPNYEGPTGITTVLAARLSKAEIQVASLTSLSPFYVQSEPNPSAVIAIVQAVDRAYGSQTKLDALRDKQREVDSATEVAAEQATELRAAITSLEQQYDQERGITPSATEVSPTELPSGSEVVADLEEFFRQLRTGEGDSPSPP